MSDPTEFSSERPLPKRRHVELVVVHGIGQQKSSETLLEWAEPVLRRLDWFALRRPVTTPDAPRGVRAVDVDHLDTVRPLRDPTNPADPEDSAILVDSVVMSAPDANKVTAFAEYAGRDDDPRMLRLTVTEARWADAFLAMDRSEVFDWGIGFAFRAILRLGVYFGRVVTLGARRPRGWYLWIVAGPLWLALVATLAAIGLLVIVTLPLVGPLLLIPGLKTWLDPLMRTLVEFIGDAAVWTRRPVRAAAMRAVVRDGIAAARARLDLAAHRDPDSESLLVVLAHSEGAAIATETLFSRVNGERAVMADVLVTVGAGVTLLGVSDWLGRIADEDSQDEASDHPRNLVRAWAQKHPSTAWLNMWGIWDPVPSGPISNGETARRDRWAFANGLTRSAPGAIGPREYPVNNTGFAITDHTTYSGNVVQVIDPVTRVIMGLDEISDGTVSELPSLQEQAAIREENHVRSVKAAGLQRAAVVVLALLALAPPVFSSVYGVGRWIGELLVTVVLVAATPLEAVTGWDLTRESLSGILDNEVLVGGATIIAGVALASWMSAHLWRRFVDLITWRDDVAVKRLWVAGLVLRLVLVGGAVGFVVIIAAAVSAALWPVVVLAAALGLYVVLEPLLSPLPRIVEAQR